MRILTPVRHRSVLLLQVAAALIALAAPLWARSGGGGEAHPLPAAARDTTAAIDSMFAPFARGVAPGCAVGVIRGGELVFSQGYGMASLEHVVPIRTSSIFHVASVSKQFTVAAIVLLEQDGLLSLDDDIRRHLPEMHDFGQPIAIRHLIHHTSGLRDQWELLAMAGWRGPDVKTHADILDLAVRQRELNFAPGSEHLYSNTGYTLMAEIVRRVSGQSLREFAHERIFVPLGMQSTHFHDDHAEVVRGRTSAYLPIGANTFRLSMPIYDNVGATSLNTTVGDLARWDRNFYEPVVGGARLLEVLHGRGVLNGGEAIPYAGALSYGSLRGVETVGHSGADAGFRAQYLRIPSEELSVAVLCNRGDANPVQLAREVAELYIPSRSGVGEMVSVAVPPRAPSLIELATSDLLELEGVFHSPELDVHWEIAITGDGLMLRRRRFPDVVLLPIGDDTFSANQRLRFTRDADGRVDGFLVTGSRVREVRFDRVGDRGDRVSALPR